MAQIQHMDVDPLTLEYACNVISYYFSDSEPFELCRPVSENDANLVYYALKQFRALQLEGVSIDSERLNGFLPPQFRTTLNFLILPTGLGGSQQDINVYIDCVGEVERPFEVACIFAIGNTILHHFYARCAVRNQSAREKLNTRYKHGLKERPQNAVSRDSINSLLLTLLLSYQPKSIYGCRNEISNLLPTMRDRFVRLLLLPWQWRRRTF